MRILDRRIDIERRSPQALDIAGQPIESWVKIVQRRSAVITPVRGDERFTSQQFVARQQVEFRIRYSESVADLNPLDRIIYPAATAASPEQPNDGEIYDV